MRFTRATITGWRPALVTTLILTTSALAAGTDSWEKTYGGNRHEFPARIGLLETRHGYVVLGNTKSFGAGRDDVWLLALNPDGSLAWQRTYGGDEDDRGFALAEADRDGIVVAGSTKSFGGGRADAWVLRLDGDGNVLWQKAYGGAYRDVVRSIRPTDDGGFIFAAETGTPDGRYDLWIVKLDSQGEIEWQRSFGRGSSWCIVGELQRGGFVAATEKHFVGDWDLWIARLDLDGEVLWQKRYGEPGQSETIAGLSLTDEDDIVIAGGLVSGGRGPIKEYAWVAKLGADGSVIWHRQFYPESRRMAYSVHALEDGSVVVGGRVGGLHRHGTWFAKLDENGNVTFQREHRTERTGDTTVYPTRDGGYLLEGAVAVNRQNVDLWLLKLDRSARSPGMHSEPGARSIKTEIRVLDTRVPATPTHTVPRNLIPDGVRR